ncbi:hypothetical protein IAU60_006233 [Kwoniella sp. DSM 27419]
MARAVPERPPLASLSGSRANIPVPSRRAPTVLTDRGIMSREKGDTKFDQSWANDDDSIEVEVPDFYYDWGVEKDTKANSKSTDERRGAAAPAATLTASADQHARSESLSSPVHVPPRLKATPPSRDIHSSRSSMSSANILSLTDASTASASSMVPTPPGSSGSVESHLISRNTPAESSSAGSGRMYGSRRYQRVVSAPVTHDRPMDSVLPSGDSGDTSTLSASTASHTATVRPLLNHTSLASAVPLDNTTTRNNKFMTPGITGRTMTSTARSTGRRLGALSKFGGPARRVTTPLDSAEIDEDGERGSPVLIDSPPSATAPLSVTLENDVHSSGSVLDEIAEVHFERSPPDPSAARRRTSPYPRYQELPTSDTPTSPRAQPKRAAAITPVRNQPAESRPFRPFSSQVDQEPKLDSYRPERHRLDGNLLQTTADASIPTVSRFAPVSPPRPTRASSPTESIRAARPAPVLHPQTSSAPMPTHAPPAHGIIEAPHIAQTLPQPPVANVQPQALGRTTFLVNSVHYERLQRLGKGGSSTVYSVLYTAPPKKRVMECGEIDFAALLDEQRGKAINMNFVGLYWEQMLEAVQAVHQENVVHTDLKPANFVLVKGRLKIIDFGIAKAVANDTVNIQRDQQLSYPSDIWSLGCILYQMIYGAPPFQHIGGGPLGKMSTIANPNHIIEYPELAVPKATVGVSLDGQPIDPASLAVRISPSAIDSMKRCLAYRKEHRLTIPELLHHEFLKPKIKTPDIPPDSTTITQTQMERLVSFILTTHGLPDRQDQTAEDLFWQLQSMNALTSE